MSRSEDEDVKVVKDEMRNVVNDLEIENACLKAEIKRVNRIRDQLECIVGKQTNIEKKIDIIVVELHDSKKKMLEMEKELEVYKSLELSQKAMEAAKWILETERAVKRAREG